MNKNADRQIYRLLVIDDNVDIHEDMNKIFCNTAIEQHSDLDKMTNSLFGAPPIQNFAVQEGGNTRKFEIDSASQGEKGLELVEKAISEGRPYAVAFVDIRMPPGWDGVKTIEEIRKKDPELQFVICTAYSEYSWQDLINKFGYADNLLILKKPFDAIEALQIGTALTQKWLLSKQAKHHTEELKTTIDRKTEEITKKEAELRQAQKMNALGQLAGGIAHDFNNLLTVILGSIEMATRTIGQKHPISPLLTEAISASNRASSLTKQLLAFSRRQVLQMKELDLNSVISSMEPMLKRVLEENIVFEHKLAQDLWQIRADQIQVEQVILNLLLNARDAMLNGGNLTIETKNASIDASSPDASEIRPGNYVLLTIRDTGTGMSKETLARLFEPFFTTKEIGKGYGLGLAVVFGIVKQVDGNILVESELGQGTTFKIYFPKSEEGNQDNETTPVSQPKTKSDQDVATVLVVEDQPSLRNMLCDVVKDMGLNVLAAEDGLHALDLVKNHSGNIDVVLTDVVMPKMSGRHLADHLANLKPEASIIFMSGYTQDDLPDNANFIAKPFSIASLIEKIQGVI